MMTRLLITKGNRRKDRYLYHNSYLIFILPNTLKTKEKLLYSQQQTTYL